MTSATRNECRFTGDDRDRICHAITTCVNRWARGSREMVLRSPSDTHCLQRVAAHSIGCALVDLRTSELDWIDAQIVSLAG